MPFRAYIYLHYGWNRNIWFYVFSSFVEFLTKETDVDTPLKLKKRSFITIKEKLLHFIPAQELVPVEEKVKHCQLVYTCVAPEPPLSF